MANGEPTGFLSDNDIRGILDKDIVICNYLEGNLTDIGYNLTPTEFVFSINRGLLMPIYNKDNQRYCWVEPTDTVLIITREALWVSEKIAGTFHSKVKIVSQGFGHISTTLDAYWEGPLLISLNNPTQKKLKFVIGEDKGNGFKYSSFVTLILYRMATATKTGHDNLPCRMDILKKLIKSPPRINLFPGKYRRLEEVIVGIQDFGALCVGIGASHGPEREERITEFKKKYTNFTRQIEFHISQAHSINLDIMHFESVLGLVWKCILFVPIMLLIYYGNEARVTNDSNGLALYAILASVYMPLVISMFKLRGE